MATEPLKKNADDLIIYLDPNYGEQGLYDRIEPLLFFASKVAVYGPLQSQLENQGVTVSQFDNWLRNDWVNVPVFEDFLDKEARSQKRWPVLREWSYLDRRLIAYVGSRVFPIPLEKRQQNEEIAREIVTDDPEPLRIMLNNREWLPAQYNERGYNKPQFEIEAQNVLYDFINDITAGSTIGTFIPFVQFAEWGNLHAALASLYPQKLGVHALWGMKPEPRLEVEPDDPWVPSMELAQIAQFVEWLRTERIDSLDKFRLTEIAGDGGDVWLRRRIFRSLNRFRRQLDISSLSDDDYLIQVYAELERDFRDIEKQASEWFNLLPKSNQIAQFANAIMSGILGLVIEPKAGAMCFLINFVTAMMLGKTVNPNLTQHILDRVGHSRSNYAYLIQRQRQQLL